MQSNTQFKTPKDDVKIVRIKRLRDDDALEALLLENDNNTSNNDSNISLKRRKFMYKRVDINDSNTSLVNENTPTLEKTADNRFLYERRQSKRKRSAGEHENDDQELNSVNMYVDDSLSEEVNSLLSEFIAKERLSKNVKNLEAQKILLKNGKRLRRNHPSEEQVSISSPTPDNSIDDTSKYVYDIYIKEEITDDSEFILDKSSIGYLKIVEDGSLIYDENSDAEHLSDDEDSNEEDYYKNDYPDDEDDDRSILFGEDDDDDEDGLYYKGRRGSGEFEEGDFSESNFVSYDELSSNRFMSNDIFGDTMTRLDNNLHSGNFLDSLNVDEDSDNSDDDPAYYYSDNENDKEEKEFEGDYNFPRNQFFATDQDDPLAIYRDKIMYSLEKKIKKNK
ncbi:hypothetical protein ACO0SA_001335 [Hanseniaspora valbyensis]